MASDSTARNVADRVDALAEALRAARVPPERSAGLLAAAATAAMHAVMLDALLEEDHGTAVHAAKAEQTIRVAA